MSESTDKQIISLLEEIRDIQKENVARNEKQLKENVELSERNLQKTQENTKKVLKKFYIFLVIMLILFFLIRLLG